MLNLSNLKDFELKLTRAKFEDICKDVFLRLIPPIEKALAEAKLTKLEIDEIVMVGGSTRILKVRELIKNYFGKPLNYQVNPDEAVAAGAAIQAATLIGNVSE